MRSRVSRVVLTALGARSDSSNESMIINGLDLNYLGVYDVWNNDLGMSPHA